MTKCKIERLDRRVDDVAARSRPPDPNPDIQAWVKVAEALTEDERIDLARAIKKLEELHGTASLETLPPAQRLAWEKAHRLYGMEASAAKR